MPSSTETSTTSSKSNTSDVTVTVVTEIKVTGEIGDGGTVKFMAVHLTGSDRDLRYLQTQFHTDSLRFVYFEKTGWWLYTTRYNGRDDWATVHREFLELVSVMSGLLSLLRHATTSLVANSAVNWFGSNDATGVICPMPHRLDITVSNDFSVTYVPGKHDDSI